MLNVLFTTVLISQLVATEPATLSPTDFLFNPEDPATEHIVIELDSIAGLRQTLTNVLKARNQYAPAQFDTLEQKKSAANVYFRFLQQETLADNLNLGHLTRLFQHISGIASRNNSDYEMTVQKRAFSFTMHSATLAALAAGAKDRVELEEILFSMKKLVLPEVEIEATAKILEKYNIAPFDSTSRNGISAFWNQWYLTYVDLPVDYRPVEEMIREKARKIALSPDVVKDARDHIAHLKSQHADDREALRVAIEEFAANLKGELEEVRIRNEALLNKEKAISMRTLNEAYRKRVQDFEGLQEALMRIRTRGGNSDLAEAANHLLQSAPLIKSEGFDSFLLRTIDWESLAPEFSQEQRKTFVEYLVADRMSLTPEQLQEKIGYRFQSRELERLKAEAKATLPTAEYNKLRRSDFDSLWTKAREVRPTLQQIRMILNDAIFWAELEIQYSGAPADTRLREYCKTMIAGLKP